MIRAWSPGAGPALFVLFSLFLQHPLRAQPFSPLAAPLAQEFVTVAQSPDKENIFVGSPTLCRLPSGRILAAYEWFTQDSTIKLPAAHAEIVASDDRGRTWRKVGGNNLAWASLFTIDGNAYMLGQILGSQEIAITRSIDEGNTWTVPTILFAGRFCGAPTSVVVKNGFVYRAFEDATGGPATWRSLVVAGDLARNLVDPASWRMSERLAYPGTPDALTRRLFPPTNGYRVPIDGWLEGNIVDGRNGLHVILRVRIDGMATAGLAAVCDLSDDGKTMTYRFGQLYPVPGAQGKFHIVYDALSNLYWMAASLPTNTLANPAEHIRRGFFGVLGNERRILTLAYSYDAFNWFQAGCIAYSRNPLESFSQGSLLVDGENLLVLARTALDGSNQHDTNLITLHRIANFRNLALDLIPDFDAREWRHTGEKKP